MDDKEERTPQDADLFRQRKKKENDQWAAGTVYMSNNINPFTVMPLAPNQVEQGGNKPNILADTISAFTEGGTIQFLSPVNITTPNTFQYNGQSILPTQIYNNYVTAVTNQANGGGRFQVNFNVPTQYQDTQFQLTDGNALFRSSTYPDQYNVEIDGSLYVGSNLQIQHNVGVSGDVTVDGSVYLGPVILKSLGIGVPTVTPGYVLEVSGASLFNGSINTIGNVSIGNATNSSRLDISGITTISKSLYTSNIGVGTTLTDASYALDISGSTRINQSLFQLTTFHT
jgi:hypothetical protein